MVKISTSSITAINNNSVTSNSNLISGVLFKLLIAKIIKVKLLSKFLLILNSNLIGDY